MAGRKPKKSHDELVIEQIDKLIKEADKLDESANAKANEIKQERQKASEKRKQAERIKAELEREKLEKNMMKAGSKAHSILSETIEEYDCSKLVEVTGRLLKIGAAFEDMAADVPDEDLDAFLSHTRHDMREISPELQSFIDIGMAADTFMYLSDYSQEEKINIVCKMMSTGLAVENILKNKPYDLPAEIKHKFDEFDIGDRTTSHQLPQLSASEISQMYSNDKLSEVAARLVNIGLVAEMILGSAIEQEDIPSLISFLAGQEKRRSFFSDAFKYDRQKRKKSIQAANNGNASALN